MSEDRDHELLTKVVKNRLTLEERRELIERLGKLEHDEQQPIADRMGAIVLRASLMTGVVPHGD